MSLTRFDVRPLLDSTTTNAKGTTSSPVSLDNARR